MLTWPLTLPLSFSIFPTILHSPHCIFLCVATSEHPSICNIPFPLEQFSATKRQNEWWKKQQQSVHHKNIVCIKYKRCHIEICLTFPGMKQCILCIRDTETSRVYKLIYCERMYLHLHWRQLLHYSAIDSNYHAQLWSQWLPTVSNQ